VPQSLFNTYCFASINFLAAATADGFSEYDAIRAKYPD
jgi:hypothetical protein